MSSTETPGEIDFLRGLRATRSFSEQQVPEQVLRDILETARSSGSAMNEQPWHFIVVQDSDTLIKIAQASSHAGHVAGAATAIAIVLDNERPDWDAFDEGRVAERIMLAARAHGIGSCIGWLEPASTSEPIKVLLEVPSNCRLRTVISLGYPRDPRPPSPRMSSGNRKPLSEIVSFEHYSRK